MRQETINIYKFNELSKKAKIKAIECFRDVNTGGIEWYDGIYDTFKEMMKSEHNITVDEIRFSGFASQGDGASFTTIDKDVNYRIIFNESRYCHANTMSIEFTEIDVSDNQLKAGEEFLSFCKSFADNLYHSLETTYDDLTSDDLVIEAIESNEYEYEFLTTGELI